MAGTAQIESLAAQVRHLQELVRRLGTRLPPTISGLPITTYDVTDADLYNSGVDGWFLNDPVTFIAQGNTAHVIGSVQWTGAGGGYPHSYDKILRPSVLPAAFCPDDGQNRLLFSGQPNIVVEEIWAVYLFSNGFMELAAQHLGTPAFPWGTVASGTPVISLSFSYPLTSP